MHTNLEPRTFDFTGSCLLIKPFRVALFHNVEGRIDEDFNKVETGVLVDLANKRAIIAVGRDERGQRYTRSVRKQARDLSSWWPPKNDFYGKAAEGWRGGGGNGERVGFRGTHLADSADVFVAGLLIKSEIFIQAETDVVPVQSVREFVQMEQMLFESACDRGLCGMGEIARYPKRYAYPTLPLALSPVNQIVIPFCCRRSTLSLMSTDPKESVSDRASIGRTGQARTRMERNISSHCQEV